MARSKSIGLLRTPVMSKLCLALPALAVAVLASSSASGSVVATNSQGNSPYSVSGSDLLEGLTPVSATTSYYSGIDGSASGGLLCLTDGTAPTMSTEVVAVGTVGTEGGYSAGYTDIIYNFATPVNLSAVNLYFYWGGGRTNPPPMTISVDAAATSNASDPGWTTVINTPEYDASSSTYAEAYIADNTGAPIATGIESLQITFGGDLNGWSGLGEIDAIQGTPEPATLGIVSVVCGAGLLRRRAKS
jgi:hypothetical protein